MSRRRPAPSTDLYRRWRGSRAPVERKSFPATPLAAVDVTCEGRPGYPCGLRLVEFWCDERPERVSDVGWSGDTVRGSGTLLLDGDDVVALRVGCRCGATPTVAVGPLPELLAGMVDMKQKRTRVSVAKLAALA